MRMRECEYGLFRGKVCVVLLRYNAIISREKRQVERAPEGPATYQLDSSALRSRGRAARCRAISDARVRARVGERRVSRSFHGRRLHNSSLHYDLR
jgi:hypothetical protein